MKSTRKFNAQAELARAQAGELTGAALRKAIQTAEAFGMHAVAHQLQLCVVSPASFAGDALSPEIRERVAQGISALTAMGESLARTKQMLKKYGVVETINRIVKYPASTKNFDRLCAAGLEHLTAEAIVLDYPQYFSEQAIEVAKQRLGR